MTGFKLAILLIILVSSSIKAEESPWRESAILVSVASLLAWNPMKLDGVGFEHGVDNDFSETFKRTRMLWLWKMEEPIKQIGSVTMNGHYEFEFGQILPSPQNVTLAITPIIEWQLKDVPGSPMIETGLSANWLSLAQHGKRDIGTHFQFGQLLGLAFKLGHWQLGVRYQHISNFDIKQPNNGYNFFNLVVKYWY